jgi:putative ABC transport system permease protein
MGLAVGTTLLASIYPAWTASRKQIVDALRHNR